MIPRFSRNYELIIQPPTGGQVKIAHPFRIGFQADKSTRGMLNKIQIKLYNIPERYRLAIVKDAEERKRIPFQLAVGYQDSIESLFKGTVHRCSNARAGVDIITTIEGLDGGDDFINAFTSRTVEGGQRAIEAALSDMTNTGKGKITERPTLTRPKVLVGNSAKLIDAMVNPGETWYIENEQLYAIKDDEVVGSFVPVVNASTGLISTPERENKEVTFKILMNAAVKIGRRVKLESQTAPHLDGVYRVDTISYAGDNFGDDWSQTCTGQLASRVTIL